MKANLIVADLETGGNKEEDGKQPYELYPITEVCLYIINPVNFKLIEKYQTYVKPYNSLKITKGAIEATQVDMKDIMAGIDIKTLVAGLIIQFKKAKNNAKYDLPQIIFHNASFDILFLEYAFEICGKNLYDYLDRIPICTMRMIKLHDADGKNDKVETSSVSLSASCARFDIKLKNAHGAENDVIATTALFKAMTLKLRNEGVTTIKTEQKETKPEKQRKYFQI